MEISSRRNPEALRGEMSKYYLKSILMTGIVQQQQQQQQQNYSMPSICVQIKKFRR